MSGNKNDANYVLRKLNDEYEKGVLEINTDKRKYTEVNGDLNISKGIVKGVNSERNRNEKHKLREISN